MFVDVCSSYGDYLFTLNTVTVIQMCLFDSVLSVKHGELPACFENVSK